MTDYLAQLAGDPADEAARAATARRRGHHAGTTLLLGTLGMSLQRRPLAEVHDCKMVVEPCIWSLSFSSVSSLSIYMNPSYLVVVY